MGLSSSPPSFQAHYITALSIRTHVNIFRIPPSSSSKRKRKRPVQQSSNIQQQHQRKSAPLPPLPFSSRRRLFFLDARLRGSLLPNVESPPLSTFFSRDALESSHRVRFRLYPTPTAHMYTLLSPPPVCKAKFAKRFPPMPGKLFHVKQLHSTTVKM